MPRKNNYLRGILLAGKISGDGLEGTGATSTPVPPSAKSRVPPEIDGIQVNFCKNPTCKNYGVPPKTSVKRGGSRKVPSAPPESGDYVVVAAGKGMPLLQCKLCGEYPPIKSNIGIAEEVARMMGYLYPRDEPTCPNPGCLNHGVGVSAGKTYYYAFGLTDIGSQRYQCRRCRKTFSVGQSTRRQRMPSKNRDIFLDLMNKAPFNRICEKHGVNIGTVYRKMDFIHQQCLRFVADREQRLMDGMVIPRLYLATDRQDYAINWSFRKDKRNVVLHAAGTADQDTGYVFGMHLNFDYSLDSSAVEATAVACGDYAEAYPHRQHARLWLQNDYAEAVAKSKKPKTAGTSLESKIGGTYAAGSTREDVEAFECPTKDEQLPLSGMQVHAEYSLYGHFFFLKRLLPGVNKFRFYLDQDSGMRAACLAAFQPEIKERRADAFYVRIMKETTTTEKRKAVMAAKNRFKAAVADKPGLSEDDVKVLMMVEELGRMRTMGPWADKWATHPLPTSSEPEKAMCYLTDYGDLKPEHLARLYLRAALHPIDRFFMQVRRRLSLLERPIGTSSKAGRTWYGYSAYKPENIVNMLEIFRVYYNYSLPGADKKTPAMRLGLANGVIDPQDVIYFMGAS
jgi:transposase-like protein